jgi:hypothetical protein
MLCYWKNLQCIQRTISQAPTPAEAVVVTFAVLLEAETFPAASFAFTVKE